MANYQLNASNPANPKRLHKPQAKYLEVARGMMALGVAVGIIFLNYVGGRGCGKTTIALLHMIRVALVDDPLHVKKLIKEGVVADDFKGFRTVWSARTNGEIDNVLINELERIVPSHLYRLSNKGGARCINWISGHKTFLISRSVDNPKKRVGLGFNVMGVWHDEAATGFSQDKFSDINNAIREPNAPYYFCATTSTPLPNAYQLFCQNENATTIYATSYDSPYLNKANLDAMASQMDDLTVQQELMGRFVLTTGKQWDTFEEKAWPDGNILEDYEFNPDLPFYLGVDLGGNQSAVQVVQYVEPLHPITGQRLFQGKLAVVVAEYVPNAMGIEVIMQDVVDRYCDGDHMRHKPQMICVGHDVNAAPVVSANGASYFASLGWPYTWPRGKMFFKETQRMIARGLILNKKGERRFCVAANKNKHGQYEIAEQHYGQNKQRGILNVMRNDTYDESGKDDIFVKDKGKAGKNALEDDRDAMLYWMAINHPMTFNANVNMPV